MRELQAVRKRFGGKAVAKQAGRDAKLLGSQVDEYFTVTQKEMEVKKTVNKEGSAGTKKATCETQLEKKDICHVKDTSAYIEHLIKLRGLDPTSALVRIGVDGGGGSVKVMVNVFDPVATGDAPTDWSWSNHNEMLANGGK